MFFCGIKERFTKIMETDNSSNDWEDDWEIINSDFSEEKREEKQPPTGEIESHLLEEEVNDPSEATNSDQQQRVLLKDDDNESSSVSSSSGAALDSRLKLLAATALLYCFAITTLPGLFGLFADVGSAQQQQQQHPQLFSKHLNSQLNSNYFVFSKLGKKKKKKRPTTANCPAVVSVSSPMISSTLLGLRVSRQQHVSRRRERHNHSLIVSPRFRTVAHNRRERAVKLTRSSSMAVSQDTAEQSLLSRCVRFPLICPPLRKCLPRPPPGGVDAPSDPLFKKNATIGKEGWLRLDHHSFSVNVMDLHRNVSTCQRVLRAHCGLCIHGGGGGAAARPPRPPLRRLKKSRSTKALMARGSRALQSLSPQSPNKKVLRVLKRVLQTTKRATSSSFNLDTVLTKRPTRPVEVSIVKSSSSISSSSSSSCSSRVLIKNFWSSSLMLSSKEVSLLLHRKKQKKMMMMPFKVAAKNKQEADDVACGSGTSEYIRHVLNNISTSILCRP